MTTFTLQLPLDRAGPTPLHQQVFDGCRRAILTGRLRPGQRLPSTRILAAELGISRFPVLMAYEQLQHEGYLEGRSGSGTYVTRHIPDDLLRPAGGSGRTAAAAAAAAGAGRSVAAVRDEGGLRPFRVSLPALDRFPRQLWSRLVARHARALAPELMAYGDPAGHHPLREAIADYLRATRAVRCEAEQILVVPGSQTALRICATVLASPGDVICIEEPGYPGAREALAVSGAVVTPVGVDEEGVDAQALAAVEGRVRAAYVTPSHQYPLGMAMSAARRLELLSWAERTGAWILEDDYDSEYRYASRPLGSLQGMEAETRVIYIGTFSKVLFPALRMAYVVVPPALWDRFVRAREAIDIFSPTLYQLVLTDFLRDGHFARHLRRMRAVYLGRRAALLEALRTHCAGLLDVFNADAGLHLSARLAPGLDDVTVVRRLAQRGLTATPLSGCYAGDDPRSGLLLGFGGTDEAGLHRATRILGEVLRDLR